MTQVTQKLGFGATLWDNPFKPTAFRRGVVIKWKRVRDSAQSDISVNLKPPRLLSEEI